MILSFAWTLEPLLSGRKTRTCRDWSERHMRVWQNAWDEGLVHQAWDKSPRAGGKCRGFIKLVKRPRWERLCDMTEADLVAEGGLWATREELIELVGGDPEKRVAILWLEWLGEEA